MTRVVWNAPGERIIEGGLDRGVLYIKGQPGVPWNGLISVDESTSGGEAVGYYVDGIKYLNNVAPEEYTATLNAFSHPPEFRHCDGYLGDGNGLYFGQQPRKEFGLTYRTGVGDDLVGMARGNKIHFVYNIVALPSTKSRKTNTNVVSPMTLSWVLNVKPISIAGIRETAHIVLETSELDPEILSDIEDVIYGTASTAPRLPTPLELIDFVSG